IIEPNLKARLRMNQPRMSPEDAEAGRAPDPILISAHPRFGSEASATPPQQLPLPGRSAYQPTWYVDQLVFEQESQADLVEAIVAEQEGRSPEGRLELLPE